MSQLKNEISSSDFEVEGDDRQTAPKVGMLRAVDTIRVGLTVLALAAGAAVLGLGADTLAVYKATSLPGDYLLHLWPEEFDIRPATSLIACGVLVFVANSLALAMSKVSFVSRCRATLASANNVLGRLALSRPVVHLSRCARGWPHWCSGGHVHLLRRKCIDRG